MLKVAASERGRQKNKQKYTQGNKCIKMGSNLNVHSKWIEYYLAV